MFLVVLKDKKIIATVSGQSKNGIVRSFQILDDGILAICYPYGKIYRVWKPELWDEAHMADDEE